MHEDREIGVDHDSKGKFRYRGKNGGEFEHTNRKDEDGFHWRSDTGDLTIKFKDGRHPFKSNPDDTAPKGQTTKTSTVNCCAALGHYPYTVVLKTADGTVFEDPEVIVEDTDLEHRREGTEANRALRASIKELIDQSFKRIEETSLKRDPNALLFTNGVTKVAVTVTAPLKFTFEVSGPGGKS